MGDGPIYKSFNRSTGGDFAARVSKRLRAAGFRKSQSSSSRITGGYKVRGFSSAHQEAHVTWVEGLAEAEERRKEARVHHHADLPPSPDETEHLLAYADVLRDFYRVRVSDRALTIEPLPEPPLQGRGRPRAPAIRLLLEENGIPLYTGQGYARSSGCAVVQHPLDVYVRVTPWHGDTTEDLDAACDLVAQALDADGYTYTRTVDIEGGVFRVTGRPARAARRTRPAQPAADVTEAPPVPVASPVAPKNPSVPLDQPQPLDSYRDPAMPRVVYAKGVPVTFRSRDGFLYHGTVEAVYQAAHTRAPYVCAAFTSMQVAPAARSRHNPDPQPGPARPVNEVWELPVDGRLRPRHWPSHIR